jgi:serpin B
MAAVRAVGGFVVLVSIAVAVGCGSDDGGAEARPPAASATASTPSAPTTAVAPSSTLPPPAEVSATTGLLQGVARSDVAGDASAAAAATNAFGFDLFRVVGNGSGNVVVSPYSVTTAFAQVRLGAEEQTGSELAEVLHLVGVSPEEVAGDAGALTGELENRNRDGIVLRTANQVWVQAGREVESPWLDLLATGFGTGAGVADFAGDPEAARGAVNGWVADRTEQRIPELFPAGRLTPQTVLVLANALYLDADWARIFGKYPTQPRPFHRSDGTVVTVPFVTEREPVRYAAGDGWQAAELPYVGGELAMLLVLPAEETLATFEAALDQTAVDRIVAGLADTAVDFAMPKWDFQVDTDLVPVLRQLGLVEAFTPAADFSGIFGEPCCWIDAAVHAADITVDEYGTVAAAATGVGFNDSGPPEPTAVLHLDRPFLFLIRDVPTGTILFLGRVADPSVS